MGRNVLSSEVSFVDRACRRRRPGATGAPGERGQHSQSWSDTPRARIGNVHIPETTGKLVAATFEHDTARPVDGYAAPQLHTHAVVFNVTERDSGQTRALQPPGIFVSQRYGSSRVPFRNWRCALRNWATNWNAAKRPARNQGLHKGISGGFQPAPGADQRSSPRAWDRRGGGGADRRASHARPQGASLTGRCCGGTASWPRSSVTRQIEWLLRREHAVNTRRENQR